MRDWFCSEDDDEAVLRLIGRFGVCVSRWESSWMEKRKTEEKGRISPSVRNYISCESS
jgi:hypothetical protein